MRPASILLLFVSAYAQDTRNVTEPVIPPVCTTLNAALSAPGGTLAEADEQKLDTARIQKALDSCAPGHAVQLAPSGGKNAFLTGPLDLRNGVTLLIAANTILFGSRDPRLYDITPGVCGTITERGHGCKAIINGNDMTGAGVMGDGIIDGRGGSKILGQDISWWDLAEKARRGGVQNNPRIMILSHCDNFTVYRITLKDSPNFHVYYGRGNGFTAWGVTIHSPKNARNTDGIDPANSKNVTITHCNIHTGDDQVAIKAGSAGPTSHMTIAHNQFFTGHGISIGSETDGGASAIRVTDLTIDGADNGIRIKSNASRGGSVHDIVYENIRIRNTKNPILMDTHYDHYTKAGPKIPVFTGIVLRNVQISGSGKITLDGYDAEHRLGIVFDNVRIDDPAGMKIFAAHADVKLGPGPVNFRPTGDDVHVTN